MNGGIRGSCPHNGIATVVGPYGAECAVVEPTSLRAADEISAPVTTGVVDKTGALVVRVMVSSDIPPADRPSSSMLGSGYPGSLEVTVVNGPAGIYSRAPIPL